MSEKRFKVDYEVGVLDTLTDEIICDCQGSAEEVVTLLNELHQENIDLDDENARLLGERIKDLEHFEECVNKAKQLKEENEQLKKQLEIRTESDKYHQRMLKKWLCKNE